MAARPVYPSALRYSWARPSRLGIPTLKDGGGVMPLDSAFLSRVEFALSVSASIWPSFRSASSA